MARRQVSATRPSTLRVHPGHVGMFESQVGFDITRIKGIRNMLFGGDGIFLAQLTGPGRVWLQTLTISNLAHAPTPYLPSAGGERTTASAGAGAVVGSVLGASTKVERLNRHHYSTSRSCVVSMIFSPARTLVITTSHGPAEHQLRRFR